MTIEQTAYDRWIGATIGAYRLEELIGQSELGPLFGARGETPGSTYLLCLIAIQPSMSPSARALYQSRFQQQAGHIATLQHPYILPLVDYGFQQDRPYVVWPYVAPRTLTARLAHSGPVDPLTAGRYLDQIAGALEYAHQHATLHRSLSTNCVYLQPDGRVVVADLGLRRMAELSYDDPRPIPLRENYEACAPEQILNRRVDTYTDVYALGGVLYHLLTGRPVFDSPNLEERYQQHLVAPVPPLSQGRPGLPPALDGLLSAALAKDPDQRFRQPGALANAYHEIVAPNQAARVPFITGAPAFAGPRGTAAPTSLPPVSARVRTPATTQRVLGAAPPGGAGGRPSRQTQAGSRSVRNALLLGLVILLVAGTVLGLAAANGRLSGASSATGQVVFGDNPASPAGYSDAFTITIRGVAVPQNGTHYQAWIVNSATEAITALGTLTLKGDAYVLSGNGGGGNGQPGTSLLTQGDTIKVTQEQGTVKLPVGTTVLTGTFPTQAMSHVRHLLVSFPTTPKKIGLVVGILQETNLAAAQGLLLQSLAGSKDSHKIGCVAQSIVDILEGTHGTHYKDLGATCAALDVTVVGDGFGLLGESGYLTTAAGHASYAATSADATPYIRTHAGHVENAMTNLSGWLGTVDRDAAALAADPTQTSLIAEIAQFTDRAYHGIDTNGDEQVDPVIGEAGAITAYDHSQLMAALFLVPPR